MHLRSPECSEQTMDGRENVNGHYSWYYLLFGFSLVLAFLQTLFPSTSVPLRHFHLCFVPSFGRTMMERCVTDAKWRCKKKSSLSHFSRPGRHGRPITWTKIDEAWSEREPYMHTKFTSCKPTLKSPQCRGLNRRLDCHLSSSVGIFLHLSALVCSWTFVDAASLAAIAPRVPQWRFIPPHVAEFLLIVI